MPAQDTSQLKEKIILLFRRRGPGLPVHVASELEISPLFASAFLSELISEKKLILSHMRVGNSPLYLIPGQEPLLEKFSQHLKSKEKDAFMLLKDKKLLKDADQVPAIRVALRAIRDFAIPFRQEEEIYWRYFITQDSEIEIPKTVEKVEEKIVKINPEKEKDLNIFETKEEKLKIKKTPIKRKKTTKKSDIFFNKVKEYLSKENINIIEVESLSKNDLILKISSHGKKNLLFAYNKKRIAEADIVKASKKSKEIGLPYILLSKGGPLKKVENLIEALKGLESIETFK